MKNNKKIINWYYHQDLINFYKLNIHQGSSVLNLYCDYDYFKSNLKLKRYFSINLRKKYTLPRDQFDFIIISDALSVTEDIQLLFNQIRVCTNPQTRIFINYYNFFWLPALNVAEKLRLKNPQQRSNWLNTDDIMNLMEIESYQIVKTGKRMLFPLYIPGISDFINKYIANLPLINQLCFTNYLVARPWDKKINLPTSVSVIIPAKNEAGNIKNLIKRIPKMGKRMELIFVEGHSSDKTWETIQEMKREYRIWDIKAFRQKGSGKADAVRLGFDKAHGEILIILDADLSVPPEELPKFYNAIAQNTGEFINGSRLVYPLENQAMKFLNILGNHFFSLAFSWILNIKIKDTLCGTKVISRENYEKISSNRNYFGNFDPFGDFDLIFGAAKLNLKFVEIPVHYQSRKYGQTNISRFKHGWLLLKMVIFALNKIKFI